MAPTAPTFAPPVRYMGAQVSTYSHGGAYSVTLLATGMPLPVNSPALLSLETQAMNIIGTFGGVRYRTAAVAKSQLYRPPAHSLAPAYQPPPRAPARAVELGHGVDGRQYDVMKAGSGVPMVEWRTGGWTFQVWDGTSRQNLEQARTVVAFLSTHRLPQTYGVFGENIAGDGQHTSVAWQYGDMVYACFDYASGLQAAQMAVSERVYPSGRIRP